MPDEIEVDFEDAKKGVKLRIKGTPSVVEKYLKDYGFEAALTEAAQRSAGGGSAIPTQQNVETVGGDVQIPELPKAATLTAYVISLMYSEWGKKGRTSTEMIEAGKSHGLNMTSSTISGILNGLVQGQKLRRIKRASDGMWVYSPPTSIITGAQA